jgi:hypothetical protein
MRNEGGGCRDRAERAAVLCHHRPRVRHLTRKRFFIDNLMVRICLIIAMVLVEWLCAMGV